MNGRENCSRKRKIAIIPRKTEIAAEWKGEDQSSVKRSSQVASPTEPICVWCRVKFRLETLDNAISDRIESTIRWKGIESAFVQFEVVQMNFYFSLRNKGKLNDRSFLKSCKLIISFSPLLQNVLIQRDDDTEDLTAVVGDFGLATKIPDARYITRFILKRPWFGQRMMTHVLCRVCV